MHSTVAAILLLLPLLLRGASCNTAGLDRTLEPEAAGLSVVVASIERLRQLNVFPSNNQLLRRIAYVETRDGVDIATYRSGYHGGVWQVDEAVFLQTQNTTTAPALASLLDGVLTITGIDWRAVVWEDLRRPLFSALAASILFTLVPAEIPGAGEVERQARYWKDHFNDDPLETVQDFVDAVEELESEGCPVRGVDLVFVFDSSGSVGEENFVIEKEFAANITSVFTIGLGATQVGAVAFSGITYFVLPLNTHFSSSSLRDGLTAIEYNNFPMTGSSTNTSGALRTVRKELFTEEGGARPLDQAFPRVVVVITDGRSNIDRKLTLPSAAALHEDGVIVFAVGIGKNSIRQQELEGIASSPDMASTISGFSIVELKGLQTKLSYETCRVPAAVRVAQQVTGTARRDQVAYFQYQLPVEGMTIRLKMDSGRAELYASHRLRNPSSAFYDYHFMTHSNADVYIDPSKLEASNNDTMRRRMKREQDEREVVSKNLTNVTLFVSIKGLDENNRFVLETTFGDTSSSSARSVCGVTASAVMTIVLLISGLL